MDFTSPQKLPYKELSKLLEKIYSSVPDLLLSIAPQGWKNSRYYQIMMEERQVQYRDFIDSLSKDLRTPTRTSQCDSTSLAYDLEDEIDFETYFGITFPPLYNDRIEVFYILADLLLELTVCSLLYRNAYGQRYYIDQADWEDLLLEIPYKHGEIDQYVYTSRAIICGVPILEEMDAINCLESMFQIIQSRDYYLMHWDDELLYIRELQICYADLNYSPMPADQLDACQHDIFMRLLSCLSAYRNDELAVFDFYDIIELFNRKKICSIVLAYLHVYHEFPTGYPYTYVHYNDGSKWI